MKKMKVLLAGLLMVPVVALAVAPAANAEYSLQGGANDAKGNGMKDGVGDANSLVKDVVNIILWIVGILSVIMLVWGGIKYTTSAGDSNKVTSAKNTIIYAVIGLIIAILAYAIVNFVIEKIGN
ncbi:MAG: hypothetical protein D8G53_03660 [Candidatus Saccharimonas sp.]|jgi:hypothetical protein cdiviTM7_00627|nr:MAG: hypothetical protein D8G53_03660 [Candidatus Saccharimonas sp.]